MGTFTISWRPSGGRGEYEYSAEGHEVKGKRILLQIPHFGVVLDPEVKCGIHDGKPRLRREKPNDRKNLNLPNLVVAAACLPDPIREDKTGTVSYPLTDKGYVISRIHFAVVDDKPDHLLVKPLALQVLHDDQLINLDARLEKLAAQCTDKTLDPVLQSVLQSHGHKLASAGVTSEIRDSAKAVTDAASDKFKAQSNLTPAELSEATKELSVDEDATEAEIYTGREGAIKTVTHKKKERDPKIAATAKKLFKKKHGKLFCECCGLAMEDKYGELGEGYIEAHHKTPLSKLLPDTSTTPEDLAMMCGNCHRVIHRAPTDMTVDELRNVLIGLGTVSNQANLDLIE